MQLLPPAIFNNVLDDYSFFMISSLFNNCKVLRLNHAWNEMCEQNASCLVKSYGQLRDWGKKIK